MNEDMHSTFMQNNEKIIADLANLEMEQERLISKVIYDTFWSSSGIAQLNDLWILGQSMGKSDEEIENLWKEVNSEFEGELDYDQFCEFLGKIDPIFVIKHSSQQRQSDAQESQQEEEKKLDETIEKKEQKDEQSKEVNEQDLDKVNMKAPQLADYKDNAIVPSNGVALTPDSRVVKLIKQLTSYFRNWEKNKQFAKAKIVQHKLELLKKKELKRQKNYLRANQEKELISIENSQKMQFFEFSQAWDTFMSDYEATAYLSLEKLKERHAKEMSEFQREFKENLESMIKYSKKVFDLRRRVEVLINMRKYEEADKYKIFLAKMEAEEKEQKVKELKKNAIKREKKLKTTHQQQMAALLKRIQRDRNEQLKHRQKDSQKLIQRNRNILVDLLNKQNTEARRTNQFVQYTLGSTEQGTKKYYRAKIHYAPFVHKYKLWHTLNADPNASKKKENKTGTNWNNSSKAKNDLEDAESMSNSESKREEDIKLPKIAK
jgi:hypothetical protein